MKRMFTCIVCPNGCDVEAEYEGTLVLSVTGNLCARGKAYVIQELQDPRRTIATNVKVKGGEMPLVSVRLTNAIPKARIFDVMEAVNSLVLTAPVHIGDKVIENVLGLGSDVMVTGNVEKAESK